MGKAGFGTYRVPINWFAVQETSPDSFDWTQPDSQILHALENGLRPVPVVFGTPNFVHFFTPQNLWPPVDHEDLGHWQNFMRALADRYGEGGQFFVEHPEVDDLPCARRNFLGVHVLNLSVMRNGSRIHPGERRPRAGLAIVAALLLIAAALPASAAAKVPDGFFGIFAESPAKGEFKAMGKAGFRSYRVPVNWGAIQKTKNGGYDWTQSDYGVYYAAKHHMRPVPVVFGTPRFIHKSTSKGLYPPTSKSDLSEWRDFARALAARYSRNGDYFDAVPEIDHLPATTWIAWNEENSKSNWLPKPDPRAYGKLVASFDNGISEVDPKAKIVLGGMYGFPRDPKSMKAVKYLKKLYKVKGSEKHFDAINSHPYGSGVSDVKQQINGLRSVARKAGDRNVGLLVGELGWASKGPSRSESVVGKQGQAKRLRDGLNLLVKKRNSWNVLGAFVYTWRDFSAGQLACNWCPWAGLVTKKSKPKPALEAVKNVIRHNR